MAKVRVGVVGAGVMGGFHVKIASQLKEAKLVGLFDPDEKRAQEIAAQYESVFFPTLDELLANVSAVIVACPTSLHHEIAKNAIEKGLHLLVEKPLTQDSPSSEELATLANKKGLVLAVGMIERFNPAFAKAQALVKHDKILGIDIKRFSPYPERISDASVVWDVMIHDLDLALLLGRTQLDSIKASGEKIKSEKLDEVDATLYFKDGMIAKISCSRAKNEKLRHLQITTDRAIYDVDMLGKKLYKRKFESLIEREEIGLSPADQISLEQRDFYLAIVNGRAPRCPGDQAVKAVKLAEEVEAKCFGR